MITYRIISQLNIYDLETIFEDVYVDFDGDIWTVYLIGYERSIADYVKFYSVVQETLPNCRIKSFQKALLLEIYFFSSSMIWLGSSSLTVDFSYFCWSDLFPKCNLEVGPIFMMFT